MLPIAKDDFLNYKFIRNIKFSPDGKNAAFVVYQANYEENDYDSNIWIYNRETKEYCKLTSQNRERKGVWLDDETILFSGVRDKSIQDKIHVGEDWTIYYAIKINGGEAYEYLRIPLRVKDIEKISDSMFLLNATYEHNKTNINGLKGIKREKAINKFNEDKDYEILDEIPFWNNFTGFTNKKRNRLYIFDSKKQDIKPITDEFTDVIMSKIKDNKILYTANRFKNKKSTTQGLYIYNIESDNVETLIPEGRYRIDYADFIDGNIIIAASDTEKRGDGKNPYFYTFEDGKIKLITEYDYSLGFSLLSDCRYGGYGLDGAIKVFEDALYFVSCHEKSSLLKKLSLNGDIEIISDDIGSIDGFDIYKDEVLFYGLRGMRLQEIYSLKDGEETQITKLNEDIYLNRKISFPERFIFENEGTRIDGYVLKPIDYDESKTYPGILNIHGGPKNLYGEIFFHEMQVCASEGYFVFYCNPRGSDGRGDSFADIEGKYGTIDYDDLMKFTDLVLKEYPQLNSNRIGVTGGSYGGFMTNWIIGHTDRFKCAVSLRSISNWITEFTTTDIGYFFVEKEMGETPWTNNDKLWFHSPLKYADRVRTPTLFIHAEKDYRCWVVEGLQMFTALKFFGVESRFCLFRGEDHDLSRTGKPTHRIRRLEEIMNWFEKYLK